MTDVREWLAVLDDLRQENIVFKNRLSEAVKESQSRPFIEEAENFQQRSIEKDQIIDLLRYDITNLLMKMRHKDITGGELPVLQQQANVLNSDIQKLASGFGQMQQSFDRYLSGGGPA
jgi:hypothetical protein